MKKWNALLGAVLLAVAVLCTPFSSYAAAVNSTALTADQEAVRKGGEVELTFSLSEYDGIEDGINSVKGTLKYDTTIFEPVEQTDFATVNGWESLYYNPENGEFVAIHKAGDQAGGEVFRLKLKAAGRVQAEETQIQMQDITVSEGKEDLEPADASVKIQVISDQISSGDQQNPGASDQPSVQGQKEDGAKADSVKTGDPFLRTAGILVVLLCAGGLVFVIIGGRKGRIGKRTCRILVIVLAMGAAGTAFASQAYSLMGKGDLNQDQQVDYVDVAMLEKHLVSLEMLDKEQQRAADMDGNGKLTVTDLSLLIRKVEKTIHYDVQLSSAMDSRYVEKNQEIQLRFQAEVSYDAVITDVLLNGEKYPAEKEEDSSCYAVTVKTGTEAGLKDYEISKVFLSGGQDVPVEYKETLEVLKEEPSVVNFTAEELEDSAQLQVKFVVEDPDGAFDSARMDLTGTTEEGLTDPIQSETVEAGENTFVLNIPEGQVCKLAVCINYDLTGGQLEEDGSAYAGQTTFQTDVEFVPNYAFTFSDLKACDESLNEKSVFGKNEPVNLRFTSTNKTSFVPRYLYIEGTEEPLEVSGTESPGVYLVKLPGFAKSGQETVSVKQIVLENGKVFDISEQNSVTVDIWKELPGIGDLTVEEEKDGGKLFVSFKISDPDGTLSQKKVVIKNDQGTVIKEVPFDGDSFEQTIEIPEDLSGAYTVEVTADRDLSLDGAGKETVVVGETTVTAIPRVQVSDIHTDKTYYEKGEEISLSFRVSANVGSPVQKAVVNNLELNTLAQTDGSYQTAFPAQTHAGAQDIRLTQVVLEDGTCIDTQADIPVEVLRDAPYVEEYQAADDYEHDEVDFSFAVKDPDQAFISGRAVLAPDDGLEGIREQSITESGLQEFSLPVEEDRAYTFIVYLSYERSEDGAQTVTEEQVWESPIQMIRDYQMTFSELISHKADGEPTSYFAKGEPVVLSFASTNQTRFVPQTILGGEQEYELTDLGNGRYQFTLPGGEKAGVQTFEADGLRMNNGKVLELNDNNEISWEILKDVPSVMDFASSKTTDDKLQVSFELTDPDQALLKEAVLKILDQQGQEILQKEITEGQQEASARLAAGDTYTVLITADYDLDSNTLDNDSNQFADAEIFLTEVAASRDSIVLKDIVKESLFVRSQNGFEEVKTLDITDGVPENTDDYYAKIEMEDLPDFYAGIQNFRFDEENSRLYVVLTQENLISYGEDGTKNYAYEFPIGYRKGDQEFSLIRSADELFRKMSANLNGNYTLDCDLDASGTATSGYAVGGVFTGTLDGNGHTIYNLPTGIFTELNRATVSNLVLEDANVTAARKGILAGNIKNNSVIENVYLVDCSIQNNENMVGGFASALYNSVIRQSAAINLTVKGNNTIGGIVGQTYSGSKVEDCYVTGSMTGTIVHGLGARVGGITGWHDGTAIERCLTKVNITAPSQTGNGGIIGGPGGSTKSAIRDCVSLGSGKAYKIAGFTAALSSADNVYEYTGSSSATNRTDDNKDRIKEVEELTRAFFEDQMKLDKNVWNLDLVDSGKLPNLKADPLPNDMRGYEIIENQNRIPEYEQVRQDEQYQAGQEIAYANAAKLMPFAETGEWIAVGNQIPADSRLASERIDYILPLDGDGHFVPGLEKGNSGAVHTVRLVFEDGSSCDMKTGYQKELGGVIGVYTLETEQAGLQGMTYQYRGYIKDVSQVDLEGLVQTAAGMDYEFVIAALTQETESRLYVDYYRESVQPVLEKVIRSLVLSQQQYPAYTGSAAVQSLMQDRLSDLETLKKCLYSYNYYDKWYHMNFEGVNLSDLLFFGGELISPQMTADKLTADLLKSNADLRGTNRTYDYYKQTLQSLTGLEMMDFLQKMAKGAGYDDPSDWMKKEFDGILIEQAPNSQKEGIHYRIWDIMNKLGDRKRIVLPILTAPQEDMYLVSVPSQMIIGSMNRYPAYHTDGGREKMQSMMENYVAKFSNFYGISANWIDNSVEILNSFVNIEYDTRGGFPVNPDTNAGVQVKGVTQDPVIKWVYESVNAFSDEDMWGAGAYANGTDVYWVAYTAIGTDYTFYALTHETAHNQDGKYFYAGNGRRNPSGAEAHADGNIAQQIENGSMVFNISRICDPGEDVTNNLSYERIDTSEKIQEYYQNMFETAYVLDYLQAQAFLQLEPKDQAKVAIQVTETKDGNSMKSSYNRLSAEDFANMHLEDMEDLWENRIALKAPGNRASAGAGAYGYETFYDANWYQPHNDEGSPDSSSFKRLGQEMLGIGGYQDGYVTYMSGKSKTDLAALRAITKDPDITWKEYKLGRYETVRQNLDRIPYFNADQVIEKFKQAFQEEDQNRNKSTALKQTLYGIVKRATGDFVTGTVYEETKPVMISSAAQLVQAVRENPMGYYMLQNDIDFAEVSASNGAYISDRFIGMLDGNGHKLLNVQHTLFSNMVYAQIHDLTIDAPVYAADAAAYLAATAKHVVISDVKVENADLNLPLVKQKSGGYYECGANDVTIGKKTISSVEEFLAIGASDLNKKKDYVLAADLDFQGKTFGAAVITGTFSGKLDGAGYEIRNLTASLFEKIDGAQVKDLDLTNGKLSDHKYKGLLANTISNTQLEDIRIMNSAIVTNTNEVGMLAGRIKNSLLNRITLLDIMVMSNNTVGGVAGQIDGSRVENCMVTGVIKGTLDNGLGSRAGGITGWLSSDSSLRNCYVKAEIGGAKPKGNGGLIGGPNSGQANIADCVSLCTGANAYRISGFPVLDNVENVYELETSDSQSNLTDTNTGRVKTVTEEQSREKTFYTDQLGWSEEIWNFDNVESGGLPGLK